MTTKWSPKDPQDERDYWFDFKPLGLADDETITAVTVTVAAGQFDLADPYVELTVGEPVISDDGTSVVARFFGGTPAKYEVHYHGTTSTGQKLDADKTLEVKERKFS